jgi:DNA polymerase-3 subunit chi
MISKVAFYILNNESSLKGRDLYTCRIIEKAYSNNHKIYVHTSNTEETQNFDTQLWTFGDISFVPHEIYNQASNLESPVLIGHNEPPKESNDILVNLTSEIVPSYQQFNHLIEVIPNDDNLKALARKRFQIYQKEGYPVEVFNV